LHKKRRRDIFTGPPGAGKGTSGKAYARGMGAGVLESSFVLSLEVQTETDLGHRINYYRKNSLLVPDDDMVAVIRKYRHLFEAPGHLVLDGFMRSIPQVEFMFTERILDPATDYLVHVHIQPTDRECKRRMILRGRPENPDKRMDDYWEHSHPAVIRLQDLIEKRVTIEGDFSREEVTKELLASIPAA
jgi:adenylate kinase family enzyme